MYFEQLAICIDTNFDIIAKLIQKAMGSYKFR